MAFGVCLGVSAGDPTFALLIADTPWPRQSWIWIFKLSRVSSYALEIAAPEVRSKLLKSRNSSVINFLLKIHEPNYNILRASHHYGSVLHLLG